MVNQNGGSAGVAVNKRRRRSSKKSDDAPKKRRRSRRSRKGYFSNPSRDILWHASSSAYQRKKQQFHSFCSH